MSDCDGNPFNDMSDAEFLRYLAQNDYDIDGGYLPEGVRLFGVRDNLESLQIRYDELWEQHKRLAQTHNELQEELKYIQADNERLYDEKFRPDGGLWERHD